MEFQNKVKRLRLFQTTLISEYIKNTKEVHGNSKKVFWLKEADSVVEHNIANKSYLLNTFFIKLT